MANKGMSNEEIIQKTIQTSDFFAGGTLLQEQQNRFVRLIREFSVLLGMVRFERMTNPRMDIDKLNIGEPVTEAVAENALGATGGVATEARVTYNNIQLSAVKLKSSYTVTTETLQKNIEQESFEDTLMETITRRVGTDLEMLAIQGDVSTYTGVDTNFGRLLRRLDGWDIQTESANIVDAAGANIQKGLFSEAIRSMPQQYLQDPELRWFVSRVTATDWMDLVSDRESATGDRALTGESISPFGIPMTVVPLIPSDKAVSVTSGTSGVLIGVHKADPFDVGASDTIIINVDGAGAQTVTLGATLGAGKYRAGQIAKVINNFHSSLAGVASVNGFGQLVLTSPTVGSSSSIALSASTNGVINLGFNTSNANPALGTQTGSNAGTAANYPEGSFIWLANPKNFVFGALDGTRVYSEFNKDLDRVEVVMYNQVDAKIENTDSIVKIKNVRRRVLI